MNASTVRIVGIDANRRNIAASALCGYDMTGYGSRATRDSGKIDYLFIRGTVQASPIDYTVNSTKPNHLALDGLVTL
ncbi:hypothetical protein [Micromonospora maritima]|uniref:hypothetical protein n=1 Tax=Micromonospora maritima TaxID=986711 RepID=UPI0037B529CD